MSYFMQTTESGALHHDNLINYKQTALSLVNSSRMKAISQRGILNTKARVCCTPLNFIKIIPKVISAESLSKACAP
jgi:hypothetical protein